MLIMFFAVVFFLRSLLNTHRWFTMLGWVPSIMIYLAIIHGGHAFVIPAIISTVVFIYYDFIVPYCMDQLSISPDSHSICMNYKRQPDMYQ